MDLIESYIRNFQNQLTQQIQRVTNTHLRVASFDVNSFNGDWRKAKLPFLQYMALELLLYELAKCPHITSDSAKEIYQNWLRKPSLDKNITNQGVFPNTYFIFSHHVLVYIETRIPNIKGPCITKQIDDEYVAIEFEEKGLPRFGYN